MHPVRVEKWVSGVSAEAMFERIVDFASYPKYSDVIRSIRIEEAPGGRLLSHWSVRFRNGTAEWSEVDAIDRAAHETHFEQTAGDFAHFSGYWRAIPGGTGTTVLFEAKFDMGMPSLAELVNPVAERALRDNIALLIDGFAAAEGAVATEPAEALAASCGAPPA
ncbi:type II toxin-antitoxin system RatA family toxin [Jidongwangia harbinensis]|uniref:type II toxin-antitoxin system RatA family toxin n=1 Tax=Jidongwangia harbinensis TaxID=2878561 RepID=UPI001CDA0AE3|nr:SRPBCC family protein [Jidongwangia harbinensis]MCA2212158.1 SRPBCC family protein [Jidongwangia harbinensis]